MHIIKTLHLIDLLKFSLITFFQGGGSRSEKNIHKIPDTA